MRLIVHAAATVGLILLQADFAVCAEAARVDPHEGARRSARALIDDESHSNHRSSESRVWTRLHKAVADASGNEPILEIADRLMPQDDPDYQAWSQQLRDEHLQSEHFRRRTQSTAREFNANPRRNEDWPTYLNDETEYSATDIEALLSFDSPGSGPVTGRNPDGTLIYNHETSENGALRYARLRSVFSSSSCDDPLAANHGSTTEGCTYDCATLQAEYFPSQPSRCFLYNAASSTWEETVAGNLPPRAQFIPDHALCSDPVRCGRPGDDLLELKRTRLDWRKFLLPTPATGPVSFTTLSDGDARCTTVTVRTASVSAGVHTLISTEELCLPAGSNTYTHTVAGEHSLEIVGYVANTTHAGPNSTTFVVGTCTDVIIRLTTTQQTADGSGIVWELNDGNHNGPWQFQFPGGVSATGGEAHCVGLGCNWFHGRYEAQTCLFGNDFTLTRQGGAGWQGTVSVLSVVDDNTIYVPLNENWIIQGANVNNIPITLDARLSTGYRHRPDDGDFPISTADPDDVAYLSHANIVLRSIRVSGQVATLDKFTATRTMSNRRVGDETAARLGGVLNYDGFGSKLIFDRSVFDHNFATSGGVIMLDGRMEKQYIANRNSPQTTEFRVTDCLFWRNMASWVGGILRPNDVFPTKLTFSDSVMVENLGYIGNNIGQSMYAVMPPCIEDDPTSPGCQLVGNGSIEFHRVHSQSYRTDNYLADTSTAIFPGIKFVPSSSFDYIVDDTVFAGHTGFTNNVWNGYDANLDPTVSSEDHMIIRDTVVKDNVAYGGLYAVFTYFSDHFDGARMRFLNNFSPAASAGGAIHLKIVLTSKIAHSEFIGNSGGTGPALWLGGAAAHHIIQCLFQNNVAALTGGAIHWVHSSDVDLFIQSSSFVSNQVRLAGTAFSDLTVRLFTGSSGLGSATKHNSEALAGVHPIWFIGPADFGVAATGQAQRPRAADGSIDGMRQALSGNTCVNQACPDGTRCTCPPGASCATDQDYTCPPFTLFGHPDYGSNYYSTETMYATVRRLAAGKHRLWHGAVVSSSDRFTMWDNGGFIDIVGVQDKVSPQWCDNRANSCPADELSDIYDDPAALQNGIRDIPGCYLATDLGCNAACSKAWEWNFATDVPRDGNGRTRQQCLDEDIPDGSTAFCCWVGQMYWTHTEFEVPYGSGGAIMAVAAGSAFVRDSTFRNNFAGFGASITAGGNLDIEVTNTTFEMAGERQEQFVTEADHVDVGEANLLTCDTSPCYGGMQCRMVGNTVRMCEQCPINAMGDGRSCTQCISGKQPNLDQTSCVPCSPGTRSEIGICQDCAGESLIASAVGQVLCDQCPLSTRADPSHTQCLCDTGTYNGSSALHVCYYRGFDGEQFQRAVDYRQQQPAGFDCDTCPVDELGANCLTCEDGRTVIAPGYTIPQLPAAVATYAYHVSVFRCHSDMEIAQKRCPGSDASSGLRIRRLQSDDLCAPGYRGYMCGECTDGFGMNTNQECEPCEEAGFTWATLGAIVLMIACAFLVLGVISLVWVKFPLQHVVRCAAQPLRILITYSQVTSQLGDVLDFNYPGLFAAVIDTLRPIMDVWSLLFRALGPSECFGLQGFTARWLLRVVALPLILGAFVLMVFAFQYCRRGAAYAKASARTNAFFVVFFCYPTICIVSFAAFICLPLTDTTSVLEIDDAVICEEPSHVRMQWLSGIVIAVVALALPFYTLYNLASTAWHYENNTRQQYATVAKRMSTEMKIDIHVAEYVIRDIVIGQELGFLMDAFQPAYLYWEALDMIRKLFLVGLVLLVGRGSIAQLSTAIALSFGFFAIHMRNWPYKMQADNMFRAATELHVFIVITTALVLKNNLAIEVVTEDAYDYFLFFSFLLLVPFAFVVSVVSKVRDMNNAVSNAMSLQSVPDAEQRRRSLELHLVGLSTNADKENLRRFIDGWAVAKTYSCFLSHYKLEAAAEARILKAELNRALKLPPDRVFLDADNLTDLRDLLHCVENSDVFILMWTDGVLSRPWCLAEIHAAAEARVPILVLKINNSFRSPISKVGEILADLPAYLNQTNPSALVDLKGPSIGVDPVELASTVMKAIDSSITSGFGSELTFDPNQSSVMIQSQICDLATAMAKVACPENQALLPDLAPQAADPWMVSRTIAIYIVYAEQDAQMKALAEKVKEWLCKRCDISPELIVLAPGSSFGRAEGDVVAGDCDDVANNVDTVLLLQSKQVLADPRALARLFVAVANRAPIVPVCVTFSKEEDKRRMWNFETSKSNLERLDQVLSPTDAAAVAAASGASPAQVGKVLAQVIPNIISKPLEIDGVGTQFDAQMLDIELTLRREMPAAATAVAKKTSSSQHRMAGSNEGVPPIAEKNVSNTSGAASPSKIRVAARVVRAPVRPSIGV